MYLTNGSFHPLNGSLAIISRQQSYNRFRFLFGVSSFSSGILKLEPIVVGPATFFFLFAVDLSNF